MPDHLITPHGGVLCNLIVSDARAQELREASRDWSSWDLTERQICDLELLLNGAFSPLAGFMDRESYEGVLHQQMRLPDGTLWPIPVTLDVPEELAETLQNGDMLALRDPEGVMLAALRVEDIWSPDLQGEAEAIFGSSTGALVAEHPGARHLLEQTHPVYVGGRVEGFQPPTYYDFATLRLTPAATRARFAQLGWRKVVAFQTRNPMHRAHQELTLRAAKEVDASLLIHPVVGLTKPGDVDHYTRVRCYQALLPTYPTDTAMLSLLPLAMRMAGPREAIWHAIIRKNYGCTHLIVGRDHAGPGSDSDGTAFYGPYEAQELLSKHQDELGITIVPFKLMVYAPEPDAYFSTDEVPDGIDTVNISGTEQRRRLRLGIDLPSWFTFPDVEAELRKSSPPLNKRGFTVFFSGLSGSGKSTLANAVMVKLLEMGGRSVTLLDGDLMRKTLSSELGFSKEHRDINIRRIGFVASEITKSGGVAVCAPIAPYEAACQEVRRMIEPAGGFVLVHVATPLDVCEQRDRKGLYAKARAGIIKEFTGISDPYEQPTDPEIVIDTTDVSPEEGARRILLHLENEGYIERTP